MQSWNWLVTHSNKFFLTNHLLVTESFFRRWESLIQSAVGLLNCCWTSPAQSFLVSGLLENHDHDFCSFLVKELPEIYGAWRCVQKCLPLYTVLSYVTFTFPHNLLLQEPDYFSTTSRSETTNHPTSRHYSLCGSHTFVKKLTISFNLEDGKISDLWS
jgi:hypothetical protein